MRPGLNLRPAYRVYAAFCLLGISYGAILSRIADIQVAMGVGQGAVGLALIGAAIGMMASVTLFSAWLDRLGFKAVLLVALPAMGLLITFASLSPDPAVLFAWLFVYGLMAGAANTVVNVEADRTEALIGRRIMNRCHAIYSVGFLITALAGAVARQADIPPVVHLAGVTVFLLVATTAAWGRFVPAPARPIAADAAAPRLAIPTPAILALGAFTLAGMIYEGAAADWGVIYMRDVFAAVPFIAGLSLALGSFTQAFSRFFSDRFVERHGPVAVARTMLAVLFAGAMLATFAPGWPPALIGFALMGAGNAVIVPLAISAAARRTDRPAAINVAALTQLSWVAFFTGPPLIGLAAETFGSRFTYGIGLPLIVVSFLLAPLVLGQTGRGRVAEKTAG
jgi:MFS family permease